MAIERRSAHRTQWAAQFAVASELCKRNYQVALTLGNHPEADLMAISPSGTQFVIDVKGQYKKNWWVIKPKPKRERLFYILAYVPDFGTNEFFILTQNEVNAEAKSYIKKKTAERTSKGLSTDKVGLFPGLPSRTAQKYKNSWRTLPD